MGTHQQVRRWAKPCSALMLAGLSLQGPSHAQALAQSQASKPAAATAPAAKAQAHGDEETRQDILRHRAMAAAHEAAAQCLASGKLADQCQKELQAVCKGLAIGKYCGMKHEH